ncbi:FAD binding domain-containing protein [Microvirga brassicacearum]|uniref:Xanthine dehydrogenase family protein subunit M n=1 Tax=Microvirga brassicacearum TaxID=2580413 RepID=A0A5N3PE95_9HYPH|nr:FAD binding domain-containing protein [Microvirga brassicacearum]KAB0268039.1 xanthine dehydrogenase family protein subunit M [Microvirga brassicacearum]
MRSFEFLQAHSVEEALALLALPSTKALAGGTTLVDLMKLGVEAPARLVDIQALPLTEIAVTGETLRIGALASNSAVAADPSVRRLCPALCDALLSGASGQIRNAATMGGNLLQRTRCPFFRSHDWPCNKREPGSGCPAHEGADAHHAVLGTSDACLAVHPSDLAVALLALDAEIGIRAGHAARQVSLAAFYRLPGETPHLETIIGAGELITHIDVPITPLAATSRYLKLRGRASYEFASASVATALHCENGRVVELAVALGGLGTVPWRDRQAETLLIGGPLSEAVINRFCDALLAPARASAANAYKLALARGAIRRMLESASC